ncbi:MAG: exodeoxyribonuclease VII small subunit [Candidatus Poriferisodalaceae bacterium]|jgi:exodeoxyribonuclease VII small subunit
MTDAPSIGYADAMAELDTILDRLDRDDVDIDQLSTSVARAATLIELCRARITAAKTEVERVVAGLDEPLND